MDAEWELNAEWRTNLLIEEERERHERTVLLCRVTSIEDNFHNTSIFRKPTPKQAQ